MARGFVRDAVADASIECSEFVVADPGPRRGDRRCDWARWNRGAGRRYTIGVEEEVMLLGRSDHSLAQSSDWVLPRLSDSLSVHTSAETHASVIELVTGIHSDVAGAIAELSALRGRLAGELRPMGLARRPLARIRWR
jgi:hypothetical protein